MIEGNNEEIKRKIEVRKNKRHRRVARSRWLKNLMWWIFGAFSGVLVLFGTIAIVALALPIKDVARLAGVEEESLNSYISADLTNKSIPNFIKGISEYKVSQLPVVESALDGIVDSSVLKYKNVESVAEGSDEAKTGEYLYKKTIYKPAYDADGNFVEGVTDGTIKYEKEQQFVIVTETVSVGSNEAKSGSHYYLDKEDTWGYIKAFDVNGNYVEGVNADTVLYVQEDKYVLRTPSDSSDKTKFFYKEFTFESAFDSNGLYVEGVGANTTLYKLDNIFESTVTDAFSMVPDRLTTTHFIDLFEALGLGNFADEDSIIYDLLAGRSLDDLSSININDEINNLKIYKLLGFYGEDTASLYDLMCDAVGLSNAEADYKELALIKLSDGSFNIDNVRLVTVVDMEESEEMLNIILDAVNYDLAEKGEPLKTVEQLRFGDIEYINRNHIKVSTLLPAPSAELPNRNKNLYDMLMCGINNNPAHTGDDVTAETMVVGDLEFFQIGNVKLSTVIELPSVNEDNEEIYKIISSALGGKAYDTICLDDFNSFDVKSMKLSAVLDISSENDKLYSIAQDVAGKDPSEITIGDLIGFDTGKIRLSSIITTGEASGNKILTRMLEKDTDANPITIATLGETVNELKIDEIYDFHHFVEYDPTNPNPRYNKVVKVVGGEEIVFYERNATGAYQFSKETGVWLIVMFDSAPKADALVGTGYDVTNFGIDADGHAKMYMQKSISINELDDNMEDVYKTVNTLTIAQLIETGMLQEPSAGAYSSIYAYSIAEMADALAGFMAVTP